MFLLKVFQHSVNSVIWGKVYRIFENTSSGTAVKSAFHESIGTLCEWYGKNLFKSPSPVWVNGFRKFVGKFPAVLSTLQSPCPCVGNVKVQVFWSAKSSLFLLEPWTPSQTNLRFFDVTFFEVLVKTAYYVSIGDFRGKNSWIFFWFSDMWYVVKTSKKDLDFRNERQGGINCFLLSKIYLFKGIIFRIFPVFPSIWTLKENSVTLVNRVSAMMSKLHFFVSAGSFWWKKLSFEKTFQF